MRMDTPLEELDAEDPTLRPGSVSSIAESDPHFDIVFGCREDCESGNRDHKERLRDKRCITKSRDNNRYQALGFQLLQLARAMLAHAKRTGNHHTEIFGGPVRFFVYLAVVVFIGCGRRSGRRSGR